MNKNKYIVLFVVIILVIALWAFSSYKSDKSIENTPTSPATVSMLSITNVTSPSSAVLAGARDINWEAGNYPKNAGVNINLIRKVSDSPRQFTLVRVLASDVPNTGKYTWFTQSEDNSSDLYIEVTCSNTFQFTSGCSISTEPIKVN